MLLCGNKCGHDHDSPNGPSGCCSRHGPYLYFCNDCHLEWKNRKMVGKVINRRYGMTENEGFITSRLHNWDSKTFDDKGYPVADCGVRCYPRRADQVEPITIPTTCKDCFK